MMIMIKLLAVLMLSGSVASGSVNYRINDIKQAQPASYDYRIAYEYNAASGYYSLFGYTPNAGGIYELITFTDENTYWRSITSPFYSSNFTFEIRIYKSVLNDARFSLIPNTSNYIYHATDTYNFEFNQTASLSRMYVNVVDSDYIVLYSRSIDGSYTYPNNYVDYYYIMGAAHYSYFTSSKTTYNYISTFSANSHIIPAISNTIGTLCADTDAFYFQLQETSNIEGDDWWDIYNQGVNAGYDAGVNAGFDNGYIEGQLDNTGWQDAFTIVKGAIDTVSNVLAIELFGFFTIGTLVSIPIVVGLLFWIIEKWRGS